MRQLVTESMLVAVLGGVVGVLLAQWALGALVAFGADLIPRVARNQDRSAGAGLLAARDARHRAGDRPAAGAAGGGRERAGSAQGSGPRLDRIGQRLRASLLVAEVSLSLVLLIAAGLLLTSFARLQRVEPGFEPDGVFTAQLALPPQRYTAREARRLLRAALSTTRDAARQHVGRADRSRAAHRRADAGAGGRRGPPAAADERTSAGESPSRVAALLQHAGDSRSAPDATSTSATARACRTS